MHLRTIAECCSCAVLVTNQVSTNPEKYTNSSYNNFSTEATSFDHTSADSPSLGPTWYHCVSTRLIARSSTVPRESIDMQSQMNGQKGSATAVFDICRSISVVKSPFLPPISVPCQIGPSGFECGK